jgi:hypothetical protein
LSSSGGDESKKVEPAAKVTFQKSVKEIATELYNVDHLSSSGEEKADKKPDTKKHDEKHDAKKSNEKKVENNHVTEKEPVMPKKSQRADLSKSWGNMKTKSHKVRCLFLLFPSFIIYPFVIRSLCSVFVLMFRALRNRGNLPMPTKKKICIMLTICLQVGAMRARRLNTKNLTIRIRMILIVVSSVLLSLLLR